MYNKVNSCLILKISGLNCSEMCLKEIKVLKISTKISSKQSFIAYDCWAWPLPPRPKQSFGGRRGSRTRIATINQLYWQRLNNHSYKRCWDLEWILIALCRILIKMFTNTVGTSFIYSNSHVLIRKFVYQKAFIQSDKLSHYQFDESSIKFYPFAKYFVANMLHFLEPNN